MAYRSRTNKDFKDDSTSGSEGEITSSPEHKVARFNNDQRTSGTNSKVHMWSAFLQEQALTESLSTAANIKGRSINRGVESYDMPEKPSSQKGEMPKRMRIDSGVSPDYEYGEKRGRSITRNSGSAASTSSSVERRQRHGRLQSRGHQSNCKTLGKRSYDDRKKGRTNALMNENYSIEALMSTEFLEGTPIDQLAEEISKALGEYEGSVIPSVVKELGENHALKIFNEVRDIEAAGGMKVLDCSRRRTPGGVYMVLFKSDPDVPQEVKQKIMKLTKASSRSVKKGNRKKKLPPENPKEAIDLPLSSEVLLLEKDVVKVESESGDNLMEGDF